MSSGHWAVPSGFVADLLAQLTGVPLVVSLHGGGDVCLMQGSALYRAAGRYGFSRAARVTVCSTTCCARRRRWASDGMVIPYGGHRQVRRGEAQMRRRLACPPMPGGRRARRLTGIRGSSTLLLRRRTFWSRPAAPGHRGQWWLESLRAQADALGIGSRSCSRGTSWQDTDFAMCDVLAVPSVTSENERRWLPNVLSGDGERNRVVASRVAGIPDVIRDGVNGALVPPANPWTSPNGWSPSEDGARESMGANARERADGETGERRRSPRAALPDALVISAAEPRLAHG